MTDIARLMAQRDHLIREMMALENKVAGIDLAIEILQREKIGPKRGTVKTLLFDLLESAEPGGLTAKIAVAMAEQKGEKLLRSSAAGVLSRLARDGAVNYDGKRYRLAH